jgi:hypothetical protein
MDINLNSLTNIPIDAYDYINKLSVNPVVMIIVGIVLVMYYFLFASLGIGINSSQGNGDTASSSKVALETILWTVFVVLLLLNGVNYFFNINVVASIKNFFSETPQINLAIDSGTGDKIKEIKFFKQVFHVPGNNYTYEDGKAICKAFDSKLASYKDMEKAYSQGADWCSYGWSEGQMAYFPTQYEKWKKMQGIKGHEHDCGRPGINGGFIEDPNIKFGVNCYGYRPKMNSVDYQIMNDTPLYPKSQEELDFDRKVNLWRTKLPEIGIAPFNNNSWSVI